jgi:serine/threonine protein kinase/WD40 repeat protein
LTRSAFDSARQMLKGEDVAGVGPLAWLNHGSYLLKGIEASLEVCEVGEAGIAPLQPPAGSEKAQRQVTPESEPILGWRPAVGQFVPNTRWQLAMKLGEGGFGEVWLGRNPTTKERRVFKFCFQVERVRFLKRELTLFRLLKERIGEHPNIVRLHDVYLDRPPFYVEMDYVEGADLRSWSDGHGGVEAIPLATRLEIVVQAADGLQAAHEAGIIHRDIKPANILIGGKGIEATELRVKLTDFGIGQVVSEEYLKGITRAGFTQTILSDSSSSHTGTQIYMAPELLAGKPASTRSDIYSLGVVLYQLLAGDFSRPVTTDWANDISDPLLREDLKHCFAGNPQDRFAGAGQLAKHLRALPERRAAMERQQAEKAALERAAYRRGIMRTGAAAVLVVAAFALVALHAFKEAARADRNAASANRSQQAEKQQRSQAEAQALAARRIAYSSDMNLLSRALDDKQFSVAADLLNRQRPQPGQEDLRGWEWRYAWQQTRSDATCELCKRPDAISSLALSSDGKWLAVGEHSQGGVSVWDLSQRQEVTEWKTGEGEAICAFCPTKPTLVFTVFTRTSSTNWSCGLRLWDLETRQQLGREIPLTNYCAALAFSGDGKTLAAAGYNHITLFRFPEMTVLAAFPATLFGLDPPMAFALSSDARLAAFTEPGGRLTLMDLQSGRERWTAQTADEFLWATAISPDGKIVASHGDDVRLWDAATGAQIGRVDGGGFGMAFGKSGSTMAVSWGENLRFWDISDRAHWRAKTRLLHGLKAKIWILVLLPDESTVVTGSRDGAVTIWDAAAVPTEPDAGTLPVEARAWRFSRDSSSIVAIDKQGEVAKWQGRGFQHKQGLFSVGSNIFRAKFSEDARFLAVAPTNGLIEVWDVAKVRVIGRVFSTIPEFDPTVPGLLFLAGGKQLLVLDRFGNLHEWDFQDAREIANWPIGSSWTVDFTPDERNCLSVGQKGSQWIASLKRWPDGTQTNKVLSLTYIEEARFSPDGRLFAVASSAIGAGLWDVAALEEAVPLEVSTSGSRFSVDFSPDGARLAVGGNWTHAVQIFDVSSGRLVFNIAGLGNMFWPIRFSPDGNVLASMNHQGVVSFWRAPGFDEIKAQEKASQAQ